MSIISRKNIYWVKRDFRERQIQTSYVILSENFANFSLILWEIGRITYNQNEI